MCLILVAVSVLEGCRIASENFLIAEEARLAISYFLILGAAVIDEKMRIIPNFIPGIMVLSSLVIVAIKALMGGNVGTDVEPFWERCSAVLYWELRTRHPKEESEKGISNF